MIDETIPEQYTGESVDIVTEKEMTSVPDAVDTYDIMQERLRDVNRWHEFSNNKMAVFQLYDESGNRAMRPVKIGDYFRINIPGPDNPSGEGDDWVQVQSLIIYNSERTPSTIITVKPVSCPLNGGTNVAHFFSEETSSTFLVRRVGNAVFAEVHGRNEKPNTDAGIKDKIRNALVATGSILGFSKVQWKLLTDGIINFPNR